MLGMETLYDNSKKLLVYLTKYYGYNAFIIDNIDENLVKELRDAIDNNDRVKAVRLYLKIDSMIDTLRDERCYNSNETPYRSSFRNIAKDLYRELKESWLIYLDDFDYVGYVLRFISTSEHWVIKEFLKRRSNTMYYQKDIPLNPESFYCGYIPIEAFMYYAITLFQAYNK